MGWCFDLTIFREDLSSLDYILQILIRKQRGLTASVPEEDCLILLEETFADKVDHPCRSSARVDRVKQSAFVLGKKMNRLAFPFTKDAVACLTIIFCRKHIVA